MAPGEVLSVSEGDTTFAKVIGCHLNCHFVTGKNPNVMLSHFSGNMSRDDVSIIKFDSKHCVWKCFNDCAFHFDLVFFCHEIFTVN